MGRRSRPCLRESTAKVLSHVLGNSFSDAAKTAGIVTGTICSVFMQAARDIDEGLWANEVVIPSEIESRSPLCKSMLHEPRN